MDITNLISGLIGSAIGVVSAFLIAVYNSKCAAKENEKQRAHDIRMNSAKENHDKDMQRREQNIKKTGIASMREIGGG